MKTTLRFALALALGIIALFHMPHVLRAQGVFTHYGPQPGIQFSTGLDYHNTAATSANVVTLWSGTCNVSSFLRGDGTCAAPAGTGVTSVGASFAGSWYTVTGSPVTSTGTLAFGLTTGLTANSFLATPNGSTGTLALRTLAGADVPPINLGSTANGGVSGATILLGTNGGTSNGFFSVTGPTTSLKTFTFPNASATMLTTANAVTVLQGGTGQTSLTTHGVLLGEGTGNVGSVAAMAADTLLQGLGTGVDPAAVSVNNCGSATTALSYSTSTHTFGCQTISAGTGSVTSLTSGTAIALSPSTITTTGSISLDTTASPTITGTWTYNTAPVVAAGFLGTGGSSTGTIQGAVTNGNAGVNANALLSATNGTSGIQLGITGASATIVPCTGCLSAAGSGFINLSGTSGLSIATQSIERIRVASTGRVTIQAPGADNALVTQGQANFYSTTIVSPNTAGQSLGLNITAGSNSSDFALRVQPASGSATNLFAITGAGVMSAPTNYSSAGAVSTTAGGVFTTASDLRLKTVVGPATAGLAEVMKLKPIRYRWTEASGLDDPNHTVYAGFGAQDVLPVIPDAVGQNRDGYYSLSDRPITAALVNAVQEQQRQITELRKELRGRHGHN